MTMISRQLLISDAIVLALLLTGLAVTGLQWSGPELRPFWLLGALAAVVTMAGMLLLSRSRHFAQGGSGRRWPLWRVSTYSAVTFVLLGVPLLLIDWPSQARWVAGIAFVILYLASRYLVIRRASGEMKNDAETLGY